MSGMELLEFLLILIVVLMVGYLLHRTISLADARARIELQKRLAKTKERSSGKQRGPELPQEETATIGPWVSQLMEDFGVDPEVIFEDEMPPELKTLVPMAKGFIQSGGLQKLLAGAQQPQQAPQNDRASI